MDISERASRSNLQNIYVTAIVFHVVVKSCLGLLELTHFGLYLGWFTARMTQLDGSRIRTYIFQNRQKKGYFFRKFSYRIHYLIGSTVRHEKMGRFFEDFWEG